MASVTCGPYPGSRLEDVNAVASSCNVRSGAASLSSTRKVAASGIASYRSGGSGARFALDALDHGSHAIGALRG
jgi:hypothetical protein